ncbi:hypothetical protein ACFFHT_03370 [Gallibacterium melopsittaci]|uniref:Competence protein ComA n=1 Tax=Gallibacterium melopsittaci TaxID=516063 RepID=A0ABV6HUP8_9PAST
MKVAFPLRKKGKKHTVRVGVYFISNCFYYSFFTIEQQFISGITEDIGQLTTLLVKQYHYTKQQILYVSVLPMHLVWRTRYHYPQKTTQYLLEQQVYHLLETDLPHDGSPIWFDYLYQDDYLELYVVKQQNAEQEIEKYLPLQLNVLDVFSRVLLRAFRYLINKKSSETVLYCYYAEQCIFLLDSPYKTEILVIQEDFPNGWEKFTTSFNVKFSTCVLFQSEKRKSEDITAVINYENVQQLSTLSEGELISLGCALWGQNEQ